MSELAIGPEDAALIIRGNGRVSVLQPKQGDSQGRVLDQAYLAFALGLLVSHPEFVEDCRALMEKVDAFTDRQLAAIGDRAAEESAGE